MAPGHEDTHGEGPEVPHNPRRLVSVPPALEACGPTRRAQQATARAFPVLRSERQRPEPSAGAPPSHTAVAQVASAPKPTRKPPDLGAVQCLSQGAPAPSTPDLCPDLGPSSVRLLSGGAEWWKSPCSVLRGPGGLPARATRPAGVSIAREILLFAYSHEAVAGIVMYIGITERLDSPLPPGGTTGQPGKAACIHSLPSWTNTAIPH